MNRIKQIGSLSELFAGITRYLKRSKVNYTRLMIKKMVLGIERNHFVSLLPEILEPSEWLDEWFMKPFNGQTQRIKHMVRISDSFLPSVGIETGTYLGTSTPFLSRLVSGPTYTFESNEKYYISASNRLDPHRESITTIFGDSSMELRKALNDISPSGNRILAYLDAHWYENIPTTREIEALLDWGGLWIAIIDDFEVPNSPGYDFDKYGEVSVGEKLVPENSAIQIWVSSLPAVQETGAKRGTGYVFGPGSRDLLDTNSLKELIRIR